MSTIYSQLKPVWHERQLRVLREGGEPKPVHVQLVLSDLCNAGCTFCAYRMSSGLSTELFGTAETHNPNRKIPTEKALEIVEDCAELGVKAIQFTGGGEPTVHPDHLLVMARAQELGIETGLVTNGVLLKPTHPAIQRMAWIRVSVDAGDAETYVRVRRVPPHHWGRAWSNIRDLAATFDGVLGVGFVVTNENYTGVLQAARLAKEAGADNIRVGAVFSAAGMSFYDDDVARVVEEQVAQAKRELDCDTFEVVDLFGRRMADLGAGSPDHPDCHYQYLTMYIGGDLNVYRCCNTAYTRAGTVGNLRDQRLRDAVLAYRPFDARTCRACQFQGQNAAIRSLIEPPQHVNFV